MSDSEDDKKKKQTSPPPKKSPQRWWFILLMSLLGIFLGGLIVFLIYRSDSLFGKSSSDSKYDINWDEYNRRIAKTGKLSKQEQ